MRVTVVIPTFDSAPLVVDAIKSVLGQTRPVAEVIVVDDGSRDDTAERVREFGDRVKYIRKPNGGVSSARNRGIEEASGDLVALLDADDVWHPKKLELQLGVLERHPELVLLGAWTFRWPILEMPQPADAVPEIRRFGFPDVMVSNPFFTSSVVVRADALRAAGGFDSSFQGPEDYDMWLRLAQLGPAAVLPVRLTGYYRSLPNTLSKNAERMERQTLAVLAKHESNALVRGRPLLRRKALGRVALASAYNFADAGRPLTALSRILRSFWHWPFPFERSVVYSSLARPRLAVSMLRRLAVGRRG